MAGIPEACRVHVNHRETYGYCGPASIDWFQVVGLRGPLGLLGNSLFGPFPSSRGRQRRGTGKGLGSETR